ncbi:MAG: hypothetical protein K0B87_07110 [Candidatus Syntrophosphaera sp.]|nr:hypothetical protein [Candidatus Syntrophosphaera sp.]
MIKPSRAAWLIGVQAFLSVCLILFALSGCKRNKPEAQERQPISETPDAMEIVTLQDAVNAYEAGAKGTELDKAVALFRQQSYGNDPQAQYYLGRAHYDGRGVQQSRLEAYYWWTVSARNGYLDAMNASENAGEVFNVDDQAEIENRANDWFEHVRVTPELN